MPERPRSRSGSRLAAELALAALLATTGCDPEPASADETPKAPDAPPRIEQLTDLSPSERLVQVRRFLFGDGRGLDRLDLRVRRGKVESDLLLGARGALRVHEADGTNLLRVGEDDTAWSGLGRASEPATADESRRLDDWTFLLDAVLLRPCTDPAEVTADELRMLRCIDRSGREIVLTLDDDALPVKVAIDGRALHVEEHLTTGTGSFPSKVSDERLGSCELRVIGHAIMFDSTTFEAPKAADLREVKNEQGESMVTGTVRTVERAAAWLLLVPDPGDWGGRFEALSGAGPRLAASGDVWPVEDAALVEREGNAYLQIAFTGEFEVSELQLEEGDLLEERAAERVAQIEAPPGLWADRIVRTERALRENLARSGREVHGGVELLFNHVTRTGLANDPSSRRTMIVHLRAVAR